LQAVELFCIHTDLVPSTTMYQLLKEKVVL